MPKRKKLLVNEYGGLYREMPNNFRCPKCHAPVVEKSGKYGRFLSCVNYHRKGCQGGKLFKKDKYSKSGYALRNESEIEYLEKKRQERFKQSIKSFDSTPIWKRDIFKNSKRNAPKKMG